MKYAVTRRNLVTGDDVVYRTPLTIREIGQVVAFCARDNLLMPYKDATRHGMEAERDIVGDGSYVLAGRYHFVLTEAS